MALKRLQDLLARCLQAVDAQIRRRTFGQRPALINRVLAEGFGKRLVQPFRIVAPHPVFRTGEVCAGEPFLLIGRQRLRAEPLAGAKRRNLGRLHVP